MNEEESKAVQEVAKATSKAIDAGKDAGKYLASILGEGFNALGGAFGDWAKAYRYKNYLRLSDEIESIHRERKAIGKTIPISPKYALPILEYASLEDNDTVRNMWASLIANATDPNIKLNLKKLHIEILSSLDPVDAHTINCLGNNQNWDGRNGQNLNAKEIAAQTNLQVDDVAFSLGNLFRLGLIIDIKPQDVDVFGRGYQGFRVNSPGSSYQLSHIGRALFDACKIT